MKLSNLAKLRLSAIMVALVCLRFGYNAITLLKSGDRGLAAVYTVLALVLAAIGIIFLYKASKTITVLIIAMLSTSAVKAQQKDTVYRTVLGNKEYLDTIFLGLTKTAFIDLKGFDFVSGDLGTGKNGPIKLAVQENSQVLKLHAVKPFGETNLFLTGQDTSVQFLIKYAENPTQNYYAYNLPGFSSYYRRQLDSLARLAAMRPDTLVVDDRSELEKRAAELMSPKNKLFSAVRSKNQNITIGDIQGGVRIYLQKLYRAGDFTYFSVKITNFSIGEFQLEDFTISLAEGGGDANKLEYIHEETGFNLLKRYEKVDFIIIAQGLTLTDAQKLHFRFTAKTYKGLNFKFDLSAKDFNKRESL